MPKKILFKRYSNRRLYDTNTSAYVTLEGVAEIVREGCRVEVIDADTKEDITAYVLTQILLEEARKKHFLFPTPLLHLAIRFGDNVLADFFEQYLQEAIKNYVSYQAMANEQFRTWLNMGYELSERARKSMGEMNPLMSYMDFLMDTEEKEDREG